MSFTLRAVTCVAPITRRADAPPEPTTIDAQTRNARERHDRTMDDRIRHANHWAPKSAPREHLGPKASDTLKGIGTGTIVADGWRQFGPLKAGTDRRCAGVLAIIERANGDTAAIFCTREHARRIGAWMPSPEFARPLRGLTAEF